MSWLCITARREVGQGLSDDDDGDDDEDDNDDDDDDDDVAGLVFVSRLEERLGKVRKEVLRGGKSGSDLGRHPCANHTTSAIQHHVY